MSNQQRPGPWDWFLARMGEPIPCALCHTVTPASELREVRVTGAIVEIVPGCEITPQRVLHLCSNCPG